MKSPTIAFRTPEDLHTPVTAGGITVHAQDSDPFYALQVADLPRLRDEGYQKIGVGVVLLNPSGEILLGELKGNYKIADGTRGITSETVGCRIVEERIIIESTLQTIGRCLKEELELDITNAHLSTRDTDASVLSVWPIGTNSALGRLLGINVALLMDTATAEKASAARDTMELHRVDFVDPEDILRGAIPSIRPGTRECLRSLEQVGLLDPSQLQTTPVVFPDCPPPSFDIDLNLVEVL